MSLEKDLAVALPILASLDIIETREFYVRDLGFSTIVFEADTYLIVRRDTMELHFWLTADRIHPENTSCYIRGGQIAELYNEYETRNVPGLSSFEERAWNMKEFYVRDPHGNLLRFGCVPEE